MKKSITLLLLLFSIVVMSQSLTIRGTIVDHNNAPLPGVNVLVKGTTKGTQTDINGNYTLTITSGSYTLIARFMGFKTQEKQITLNTSLTNINFKLDEESFELDDVQVKAKTQVEKIKEKPFEVAVLDTKGLKSSALDINSALKGLSGINIRQTGGLGSSFQFSMNGLSGNQIKFFLDDIPMSFMGSSMGINNFPPNLIERVEIYKGVVPVQLGADALGGAINIITKQKKSNYLDVAYSVGSFNTHIASFLWQDYNSKNGFTAKVSSFFNYSDNNYTIDDVDVNDDLGNNLGTIDNVERFHDAYQSNMITTQVGFQDRKFADKLFLGLTFSSNKNEIQHPLDPQKPYGGVLTKDQVKQGTLLYEKKDLLKEKLELKIFGALGKQTSKFIDTVSKIYYWYKDPVTVDEQVSPELKRGEVNLYKSLFSLNDDFHLINVSTTYKIVPHHNIIFNYSKNYLKRTGDDPLSIVRVSFSDPHINDKNILGLSYDFDLFEQQLKTSLFTKYFDFKTKGIENNTFLDEFNPDKYTIIKNAYNKLGYGFASTYEFNPNIRIKASFEKTFRLPEGYEQFGNGNLLLPNIGILPEESKNYNLGASFKNGYHNLEFRFDLNGFYRDSKNKIIPQALAIFTQYLNIADSETKGIELTSNLRYKKWGFSANVTKQEITGINNNNETFIVPNKPLFFSNASLRYTFDSLFKQEDTFSCLWSARYVDEYPLDSYSKGGSDKRFVIPSQFSHNAEVTYSFHQKKYNISFLLSNLTDAKLYDNFRIQQAGRAYYLKFRYALQ